MITEIVKNIILVCCAILALAGTVAVCAIAYDRIALVIYEARAEKRLKLLEKQEEERRRERKEYRKGCEGCKGLSSRDPFYCYSCKNHDGYQKQE